MEQAHRDTLIADKNAQQLPLGIAADQLHYLHKADLTELSQRATEFVRTESGALVAYILQRYDGGDPDIDSILMQYCVPGKVLDPEKRKRSVKQRKLRLITHGE